MNRQNESPHSQQQERREQAWETEGGFVERIRPDPDNEGVLRAPERYYGEAGARTVTQDEQARLAGRLPAASANDETGSKPVAPKGAAHE